MEFAPAAAMKFSLRYSVAGTLLDKIFEQPANDHRIPETLQNVFSVQTENNFRILVEWYWHDHPAIWWRSQAGDVDQEQRSG